MLISTIVISGGVQRVGKTGVAIELSDQGARTGIVYMIQLRNETNGRRLFDNLLAGSDRTDAVAKQQGSRSSLGGWKCFLPTLHHAFFAFCRTSSR